MLCAFLLIFKVYLYPMFPAILPTETARAVPVWPEAHCLRTSNPGDIRVDQVIFMARLDLLYNLDLLLRCLSTLAPKWEVE